MRIEHLGSIILGRLAIIGSDASLRSAALALATPRTGLVIVCHGDGGAAGVLSKSDLVRHLAQSEEPEPTVAALMTRDVISCRPHDDLHAVWQTMAARGLQNLPVLDAASRPIGTLDIRDAMQALFREEELQERMLTDYIAGIGYQ